MCYYHSAEWMLAHTACIRLLNSVWWRFHRGLCTIFTLAIKMASDVCSENESFVSGTSAVWQVNCRAPAHALGTSKGPACTHTHTDRHDTHLKIIFCHKLRATGLAMEINAICCDTHSYGCAVVFSRTVIRWRRVLWEGRGTWLLCNKE